MSNPEHTEESLFEKCLELAPEERGAFLDSACGGDDELRNGVLKLLRSHETSGGFLETMNQADFTELTKRLERIAPSEESSGDQIGRYRLLELLGEGAWGSVWMAQQTQDIERRVALKVLKLGLDTKDFLARFEAERQMLAMMDHPNIARVIDAGATDFGRPYLVMELVKGVPLLDYVAKNRLTMAQRVKLFIKICQALHHAHQKGIIHRDLKPSNILVGMQDDEAVPKVIDFGVAKSNQFHLTDKTLFTSIHTFLGTPVYSSPEQLEFAGSDVDARSDVYSLGSLLYELLCGCPVFEYNKLSKEGLSAFRTLVQEKEPERPSQRFQHLSEEEKTSFAARVGTTSSKHQLELKGDLDWIVMRCLEKEPQRRYSSARKLAEDLKSYLENRPVDAIAPSPLYRIRKYITRKRPTYAVWLEVSLVLVVILAVYSFLRPLSNGPSARELEFGSPSADRSNSILISDKSIAVLPFVNLSSDEENEYLTDGLTEEILNALSKVPGLRVPARTSSFVFKGKTDDIKRIGQLLRVATVLEGSIQRADSKLRVAVRLINIEDGYQLWSETYNHEFTNIFEIQDDIARNIVSKLELTLAESDGLTNSKRPTENAEAYALYLKGNFHADKFTELDLRRAINYYEEALNRQPDYALAYAGLATVYVRLRYFGHVPGPAVVPQIREAVSKALELDDSLAEAHFSLAQLRFNYEWDWAGAEEAFKHALELNPSHVWAHQLYAFFLTTQGRLAEAKIEAERALELDPLSVNALVNTGWMSYVAGDYQLALKIGEQGIEMDPNFVNAHSLVAYTLFRSGERQAAITALEESTQTDSFPIAMGELGRMYGLVGREDDAQHILDDLMEQEREHYVPALAIASVYDGLGDYEQANLWMNKAIDNREGGLDLFQIDFVELPRENPYYTDWIKRIGLNKK